MKKNNWINEKLVYVLEWFNATTTITLSIYMYMMFRSFDIYTKVFILIWILCSFLWTTYWHNLRKN